MFIKIDLYATSLNNKTDFNARFQIAIDPLPTLNNNDSHLI